MNRIFAGCLLAVALGGSALAQSAQSTGTQSAQSMGTQSAQSMGAQSAGTGSSATTSNSTTGNKVGLAKPPAGTAPPSTKKSKSGNVNNLNNTPLTPQIAVQPSITIGSPVPINGPGGSTMNPTSSSQ